jgi:hypothetical protein
MVLDPPAIEALQGEPQRLLHALLSLLEGPETDR